MEVLISMLNRLDLEAHLIARVLEVPEREVHVYLDREMDALHEMETAYIEHEWPKVLKQVEGMIENVPLAERREMRRAYLQEKIQEIKPRYLESQDVNLRKELSGLLFELKVYFDEIDSLSKETIAKARAYPIASLIKHRQFMALCPFHNEKSPSMNIRNNFYFCHGCGAQGDVIDFVMKRDNLSFRQAVMRLQV